MQAQPTFSRSHVVANETSFVRRQAIENQMHRFFAPIHQLAQQLDKQFTIQTTRVGAEPKLPARTHRRGGGYRLALPRSIHDRSLATQSPRFAVDGVGTKTRLIPKQDLRAVALSLARTC